MSPEIWRIDYFAAMASEADLEQTAQRLVNNGTWTSDRGILRYEFARRMLLCRVILEVDKWESGRPTDEPTRPPG